MVNTKFSRKPGSVDAFVDDAGSVPDSAPAAWHAGRADVSKAFNLRLPEPHLLMLRHIAEHTPYSMQSFCLQVLLPAIEAKAAELEG